MAGRKSQTSSKIAISKRQIESSIVVVRGQRVLLDSVLAELYGVPTKVLNQAVKRNSERFPEDFAFQLTVSEAANLKSQTVTSSWGGKRKPPRVFTEHGVAMLSSVLSSPTAARVIRCCGSTRGALGPGWERLKRRTFLSSIGSLARFRTWRIPTWINGQIVPDEPVDWPDGCRLTVDPKPVPSFVGMTEEKQGDDTESIARWIAEFDAIPPLEMTPEEEAAWQGARNAQREFDMANFDQRAEALRRTWERRGTCSIRTPPRSDDYL